MRRRQKRLFQLMSFVVLAGMGAQLGSCGLTKFVGDFNPCGTLLNCDPTLYEYMASGYEGPGADPTIDPFCTWPGFCPVEVDPLKPF